MVRFVMDKPGVNGPRRQLRLHWSDFHEGFQASLGALRADRHFHDVTLSCSGRLLYAHRLILAACSTHFRQIFAAIPAQQHAIVVLPTVDVAIMQAVLDFIYKGEVLVNHSQLGGFLQVAETFDIVGLTNNSSSGASSSYAAPQGPKRKYRKRGRPPGPQKKKQTAAARASEPSDGGGDGGGGGGSDGEDRDVVDDVQDGVEEVGITEGLDEDVAGAADDMDEGDQQVGPEVRGANMPALEGDPDDGAAASAAAYRAFVRRKAAEQASTVWSRKAGGGSGDDVDDDEEDAAVNSDPDYVLPDDGGDGGEVGGDEDLDVVARAVSTIHQNAEEAAAAVFDGRDLASRSSGTPATKVVKRKRSILEPKDRKARRSAVWEYFDRVEDGMKCKMCQKTMSGDATDSKCRSSNFWKHLRRYHDVYQ